MAALRLGAGDAMQSNDVHVDFLRVGAAGGIYIDISEQIAFRIEWVALW